MEKKTKKRDKIILLDTNVFVDHLRGHEPATKFFENLSEKDVVIYSAITEAELVAGHECEDNKTKEQMLQFLSSWNKILVSNDIAIKAGDLNRQYGILIPDALIVATALIHKAELTTKNMKDFKKIQNLILKAPY